MKVSLAIAGFIATLAVSGYAQEAILLGIGDLPGGNIWSGASAVSGDGRVVGARSTMEAGTIACIWTAEQGLQPIGALSGGVVFSSEVAALSYDGTVAACFGQSSSTTGQDRWKQVFLWSPVGGLVPLPDIPGGPFDGGAKAISADGQTVVGYGSIPFVISAARWRNGTVLDLGAFPGAFGSSIARDISADGRIVVGSSATSGPLNEAFRWTEETGMVSLGRYPGWPEWDDQGSSGAGAISGDGRVIYGSGVAPTSGMGAFRWTEAEGMVLLPFQSAITAATYDGATAVGDAVYVGSPETYLGPFLWDECYGLRPLRVWLPERFGIDLTNFHLATAADISDDGRTIVGMAFIPGTQEGYVLYLPSIIEGDLDDGGTIDAEDVRIFAERMLGPDGENPWCLRADLSGDGRIDLRDFAMLQRLVPAACGAPVPGDLNGDCQQDGADIVFFADCLAGPTPAPEACTPADLDHDGDVDLADYARFQVMVGS
jgi:probable HAF family extracellular repeat protein